MCSHLSVFPALFYARRGCPIYAKLGLAQLFQVSSLGAIFAHLQPARPAGQHPCVGPCGSALSGHGLGCHPWPLGLQSGSPASAGHEATTPTTSKSTTVMSDDEMTYVSHAFQTWHGIWAFASTLYVLHDRRAYQQAFGICAFHTKFISHSL